MRVLDAAAVADWAAGCVHSLATLRPAIDGINVYPVADSDTGSNMLFTMRGAAAELAEANPADAAEALRILARGAVASAKGNSGVILSQVVRGLADRAEGDLDGAWLAGALGHADEVATGAVSRPVAGTILTVLHAVALAVRGETSTLGEVARKAAKEAAYALEKTPEQLPALARAGVVDAGARGLVAVLDALVGVLTGAPIEQEHALEVHAVPQAEAYAWEVMYLLDGVDEASLPTLRKELSGLGDSVTVAGDGSGSHAVHVHCADIGAAIEAGLTLGRPRKIRVEPLLTPTPIEPGGGIDRTVVAVVHGGALAELLRAESIPVLAVPEGETPSVEDMISLLNEAAGQHVTVLPSSVELTAAVDTAAGHAVAADRDVVVIPCVSPVQVLAALAVHDAGRRTNDDVVAMAEAAAATRRGELRIAQEESLTWVGRAQSGDVVGLVDDEVVLIEPAPASETNLVAAAMNVLNRMLALGGELVTVLSGAAAPPGVAGELAEQLRVEHPEVELTSYASGQTGAVLLMGVE
ncbi:DAK2 domain fusion protein YloV [Amycolatopsis lexingtonensis]|uniref:DAK2 domain fusion protein YloV n=1 Tax=Amycolatopsis lexingtonensis TaxID=218822 RepID=A0ABR9I3S3_9PSEU|nr:DAK2 domain-containing protein [Amycolatopsis lexingtonensis]MBE1497826.1 DAK2 domain fusion protein YloV [Amycolatopsis lexingtonensis]